MKRRALLVLVILILAACAKHQPPPVILISIDAPRGEVYDLTHDPRERRNFIEYDRRTFSELRQAAQRIGGEFAAPDRIDPEEAKKLAALGYISAGAETTGGPLPDPKDVIGQLDRLKSRIGTERATIAARKSGTGVHPSHS